MLFPANNDLRGKKADLFACTNAGFGKHGPIVKCPHCGMVYVQEKLTQTQISTYYEVVEDPLYFQEQRAREATFAGYLLELYKVFPNRGKLLDIGTNTGLFVKLAIDQGWQATGIEPNKWSVDYAKKNYGIDIVAKPFAKNVFPKASFEVLTMWDVIEHFTDPVAAMVTVHYFLKLGGVFAFSTVDPDSPLARAMGTKWPWYMEMHRAFLSRKTADQCLRQVGFKRVIFRPHWRYLSLGYLSTRLAALNPEVSALSGGVIARLGLSKTIVPSSCAPGWAATRP